MTDMFLHDSPYGPDPAQRLIVCGQAAGAAMPVVLFAGDAGLGLDRSDCLRIGGALAGHGCVAAVMSYREAPAHPFPAGPQDVAAAIGWLRAHAAEFGGDPARIVAVGHGIGALHLAGYLVDAKLHSADGSGIVGAALLSGVYDPRSCTAHERWHDLFGANWRGDAAGACTAGLLEIELPLLFTVAECDGTDEQAQAAQLVGAWGLAHAAYPPMHLLAGHDHASTIRSIGTADRRVELLLADFVRQVTA